MLSATFSERFPEWLLEAFSAVVPRKGAIYCCGPITSGKAAFDWSRANEVVGVAYDDLDSSLQEAFRREVIDHNLGLLHRSAEILRSRFSRTVIDPAGVPPIEGWGQQRWRSFWCEVISRYSSEIVVVPGWEYSVGAAGEFVCAISLDLPVGTLDGNSLDAVKGAALILDAVTEMEAAGIRCEALRECLNSLRVSA